MKLSILALATLGALGNAQAQKITIADVDKQLYKLEDFLSYGWTYAPWGCTVAEPCRGALDDDLKLWFGKPAVLGGYGPRGMYAGTRVWHPNTPEDMIKFLNGMMIESTWDPKNGGKIDLQMLSADRILREGGYYFDKIKGTKIDPIMPPKYPAMIKDWGLSGCPTHQNPHSWWPKATLDDKWVLCGGSYNTKAEADVVCAANGGKPHKGIDAVHHGDQWCAFPRNDPSPGFTCPTPYHYAGISNGQYKCAGTWNSQFSQGKFQALCPASGGTWIPLDYWKNPYTCMFPGPPKPATNDITLDFETGDLEGWIATGSAFDYQPTKGDNPTARKRGQPSKHHGDYWIGGYEKYQGLLGQNPGDIQGDDPQGTLTSKKFTIDKTYKTLDFLVAGGNHYETRVELEVEGKVVYYQSGFNTETFRRISWDLSGMGGKTARLRMVDMHSGGWGHINVDDFRFLDGAGKVVKEGKIGCGGGGGGGGGGPKPTPSASGDPHFETWSGEKYDFHGGCDLVLLQNNNFANGLGMNIHVRTSIRTWWSYIETAILQLGDNTLQIKGGKTGVTYWINGEEKELETGDASLGDFAIAFRRINDHQSQTRVDLGNHGDAISIETFKDFVKVNVKNAKNTNFDGSVGMLGSYPDGKKVGRDGKTIFEDVNAFGQEWMVKPSDKVLFTDVDVNNYPLQCTMPDAASVKTGSRRLGEGSISEEDAAIACSRVDEAHRDACIFDVMATMDLDMAGSY